jgi:Sap-like sulfolipid-1-addressing protein
VAAAVYPQLLAVVVIILTRPNPRPILWTCYLAAMLVSVGSGVLIFTVFQSRGSVAGTSSQRLGPAAYLTAGTIVVLAAIVLSTQRGQGWWDRLVGRLPRPPTAGSGATAKVRAQGEQLLGEGSLVIACLAGAVLAVPGPFDLLAVGHLSRSGSGVAVAAGTMVAFALIKFALIELPIAGYALSPAGTAAWVGRFSGWMQANKVAGVAAIVGVFGIVLLGEGFSRLG